MIDEAWAAARRAAALAGVRVDVETDLEGARRACALMEATWHKVEVPTEVAVAIAHAGGYVVTATAGDEVVGASIGFLGRWGGRPSLHSHVTAVAGGARGGGVGHAVKLHQRAWCLAGGIGQVTWTYDPLRRSNAWFNLVKLGADVVGYAEDFYGSVDDAFNAGDRTDRAEIRWDLASPKAVAAAAGRAVSLDDRTLLDRGAAVALDVDGSGGPRRQDAATGAGVVLVTLPPDPDAMAADPALRDRWRLAVRAAMTGALAAGYRVAGFTAAGRYALERSGTGTDPPR